MKKKVIRFCYRKMIDASSQKPWDRLVFESSYKEFLMQAQRYNQDKKYSGLAELIAHVPRADQLHFLVSASITGYLEQLKGIVPDILNQLGKHFLRFTAYRFEIIHSDIKNKAVHRVAISFFSEPLLWHDSIDDHLLISATDAAPGKDGWLTDMVALQPFLSIYSLKEME